MRPLLPVVAAALLVAACAEDDGRASAGTDSPADAVQASIRSNHLEFGVLPGPQPATPSPLAAKASEAP